MSKLRRVAMAGAVTALFLAGLNAVATTPGASPWALPALRDELPALPEIPTALAPAVPFDALHVRVVDSPESVAAVAGVAGWRGVAVQRRSGVLLTNGDAYLVGLGALGPLLASVGWYDLPVLMVTEPDAVSSPGLAHPPALGWALRMQGYATLRWLRAALNEGRALLLLAAVLVAAGGVLRGAGSRGARERLLPDFEVAPSNRELRVVLVEDREALAAARTAIGEEHVIAATRDAFAFARGWILAVRDGSVFELADRLGWAKRPLRMVSSRSPDLDAHPLSEGNWRLEQAVPAGEALPVVDALRFCGPIAQADRLAIE